MKKRTLILSLLFASSIGLVSCGGKKEPSSSNQTSQTTSSAQGTTSLGQTTSIDENHEEIVSILDVSKDCTVGKSADDVIIGPYTILKNTEVRSRTKSWTDPITKESKDFVSSIKIGGTTDGLKVKSNGVGTLSIYVQNGSSGVATRTVTFTSSSGTKSFKIPGSEVSPDFPDYPTSSPVVKVTIDVNEGEEYLIQRDTGTIDVYYAELKVIAEKAELTGFEISSKGKVDYVEGETYDGSKIQVNAVYGNGRRDPLSITDQDIKIDSSNVKMNEPGVYNVSVQYKNFAAQNIEVTVYQLDDITLGFNKVTNGPSSKAGNSTYVNNTVKQVFAKDEEFNSNNLTVTANCTHPTEAEKKLDVIMLASNYTVTSETFDKTKDGTYDAKVSLTLNNKTKEKTYKVHVVTTAPSEVENKVQVRVNPNYEGVIGAIQDGYNQFTTIQQALDYLKNLGSTYDSKAKVISLAEATYKEKLEITIPNLTILGDNKENVIIEWDSLYGLNDESGFAHVTDSTQTVAVRDSAVDCLIKGVTISNWFNCEEHFDERLGKNYPEHRALALLVQSDHFIMDDSKLLGYQDTVEFFTGRQIVKNTYIEGTTDFIFGSNNTTYFYNCEIHSINNAKGNGGYITAFKGTNKGAQDAIKYGAIFDNCNFTADEEIISLKKTSIGRCWGAYAAVMIMNSQLAGHISTTPSTGVNKDQRYVAMNASPLDETVQFTEYNNTGDGALKEAVAGMKLLTEEEAKNYNDFNVIFGIENGALKYAEAWNVSLD